jgi:hypothetical protein
LDRYFFGVISFLNDSAHGIAAPLFGARAEGNHVNFSLRFQKLATECLANNPNYSGQAHRKIVSFGVMEPW